MPDTLLCNTCNQPLIWIAQYSKWYCTKCAAYKENVQVANPQANPQANVPPTQPTQSVPPPPPGYYPPPAYTPPPDPNCPECQKKLTFIYQYRQWYCESCQKYHPEFPPPFLCRKCHRPAQFLPAYNQYYCPYCYKYFKVNANAIESFLDSL